MVAFHLHSLAHVGLGRILFIFTLARGFRYIGVVVGTVYQVSMTAKGLRVGDLRQDSEAPNQPHDDQCKKAQADVWSWSKPQQGQVQ